MNNNSKIYLCHNIKLDKSYKNVLNYTEQQMLTLCDTNKIAYSTTYSFIKHGENRIKVDFTYSDCLQANYIAFQNYDYSNKWFFAFINSVEYVSDKTTIINFEVDVWSTWFNSITLTPCFVEREHVNNDTLGLHTIPENLEVGEYKSIDFQTESYNNDLTVVLGMSEDYLDQYKLKVHNYNGIPAPLTYYRFDNMSSFQGVLQGLQQGKASAIVSVFLAPKWLVPYITGSTTVEVGESTEPAYEIIEISRISALDGYTPKNNKMLCYPFCYIALSNAVGQYMIYHQEEWNLNAISNKMVATMYGSLTNGCSIRVVPNYYAGVQYAWDHALSIGKFPSLAWANDVYTNWLTQNGVNILGIPLNAEQAGVLGGIAKLGAGIALASAGSSVVGGTMIGTSVRDMFDVMQQSYQADIVPAGVKGSLNSSDVIASKGENRLHIYKMTMKNEYARICDNFLTKFGYKVNTIKTPNITGRTYWNYIKIGNSEILGYGSISNEYLEKINTIARNGTTIWHNHANIGNYNLNNTIVT